MAQNRYVAKVHRLFKFSDSKDAIFSSSNKFSLSYFLLRTGVLLFINWRKILLEEFL